MSPQWTFGDRLYKIRKELDLTQQQIADRVGVSKKTVGRWENDGGVEHAENVATRYAEMAQNAGLFQYSWEWIMGRAAAGYLRFPNSQESRTTSLVTAA